MKNIHLIIAHPDKSSLNYSLYHQTKDIAERSGATLMTSDLYAMLKKNHPATRYYGLPQADKDGCYIQEEQQKIKQAELTIIQFPLYWFGFPGLLKTYFERVFTSGFAYPGKFNESPLNDGRKLLLSITTQSTEEDFSSQGFNGTIEENLFPIFTAFRFAGYHILKPFVAFDVHNQTKKELQEMLKHHAEHINKMLNLDVTLERAKRDPGAQGIL